MSESQSQSVAVIGGGIIGMSIAWRLAQVGTQVSVLEKGTIGGEASWAGAGMLAPGGEFDVASPIATLAGESRGLYKDFVYELEQSSGSAIDYQECGGLDLAYSDAEWEGLQRRAARQLALAIKCKPLTAKQAATFWPRIQTRDLAGALFYPGDAIVNPREIVAALKSACVQLGVTMIEGCQADSITVSNHGAELRTNCEQKTYDAIVIAAGAWSSSISVEGVPPLPETKPVKGHIIGYQQPEQTCNTILRHGHTYVLQRASGLLIVGASMEHAGFDRRIHPVRVAELSSEAASILPHLGETEPSETWIGFRPGSDSLRLGCWHSPHLLLAYGHFRNGILLAPATALRIVDEMRNSLIGIS